MLKQPWGQASVIEQGRVKQLKRKTVFAGKPELQVVVVEPRGE